MKLKFKMNYDRRIKKGHEVELLDIKFDKRYEGHFKVHVSGLNEWLSIMWFFDYPDEKL